MCGGSKPSLLKKKNRYGPSRRIVGTAAWYRECGARTATWPRQLTDQASAALKGAAEWAGPEKVDARQYSRKWNEALRRPTACRCYTAVRDELPAGSAQL